MEAIHGVKTLDEIAQKYGVHPVKVSIWKKELQQKAASLIDQKRGPKPVVPIEDPGKLYSEIARLRMDSVGRKKSL